MSGEKRVIISKQYLTDMGNAIRNKLGDYSKNYKVGEMADAIRSIQTNTFVTSFLHDKTPLYSGTFGTCSWEISTKGVLFLYAGVLPDISRGKCENGKDFVRDTGKTNSPWYDYRSFIKLVSFEGPVIAGVDMSYFFAGLDKLWLINSISYLNLTKSNNISFMFQNCKGLAGIDFSVNDFTNIIDMSYIFNGCSQIMEIKFPDIDYVDYHCGYDVQNLQYAFAACVLLDKIDISFLDEGRNIVNMECTFDGCSALESITTRFKRLSKLQNLRYAFRNCTKLLNLDCSEWITTNALTNLQQTFQNCVCLTVLDLSGFDISGATVLNQIFSGCSALGEIKTDNGWVFNANASVQQMFANCAAYLNTRQWDVSALQNFEAFFQDWKGNQILDFTLWDTSNALNMKSLFRNCINLTGVSIFSFEPVKCTDLSYMFYNCRNLKLDDITFFYDFDSTRDVTSVESMFENCILFNEFHFPFSTYHVTNYQKMLQGCYQIKSIDWTTWILHGADNDDGTAKSYSINAQNMLKNCSNLRELYIGNSYDSNLFMPPRVETNSSTLVNTYTWYQPCFPIYMYEANASIDILPEQIYDMDWGIYTGLKTYYGCGALSTGREVNGYLKYLASGIAYSSTSYSQMDSNIKIINFQLATGDQNEEFFESDSSWYGIGCYYNRAGAYAKWDEETATITIVTNERFILFNKNCESLFRGMRALEQINFAYINTYSVTTLESAFQECRSMESFDFTLFNTAKNQSFKNCFNNCVSLKSIDLTYFETNVLANIETMFMNDNQLETLTFFNQVGQNPLNAKELFVGCTNLSTFNQPVTSDLFSFSNLDGAFYQCSSLTSLDLNNWSVTGLSSLSYIFADCTNLEIIDIEDWEFDNDVLKKLTRLFQNCRNLYSIKFPINMPTLIPTDISYMFQNCEKLGTTRTLVNEEYSFIPGVFTLPGLLLQNVISGNSTTRINAKGVLAGCKGIKELDLSKLNIISTETLDNTNLLTGNQKNISNWSRYNIDNYANTNFSNEYDNVNDINTMKLTGRGGYEKIVIPLSVIANTNYTFSLAFNTPSGYNGNARYYITGNASNYQGGVSDLIVSSVNFNNMVSEQPYEYLVNFNSGNRTTIYCIIYLAEVSDGREYIYQFSKMGLYRNNTNALPDTTDFLSAETGAQGGYALDTIITSNLIGAYFVGNKNFTAREPSTSSITYINSNNEKFNAIPPNIADTYTIQYN